MRTWVNSNLSWVKSSLVELNQFELGLIELRWKE